MKKVLLAGMTLALVFSLAACGEKPAEPTPTPAPTPTVEVTPTDTLSESVPEVLPDPIPEDETAADDATNLPVAAPGNGDGKMTSSSNGGTIVTFDSAPGNNDTKADKKPPAAPGIALRPATGGTTINIIR